MLKLLKSKYKNKKIWVTPGAAVAAKNTNFWRSKVGNYYRKKYNSVQKSNKKVL